MTHASQSPERQTASSSTASIVATTEPNSSMDPLTWLVEVRGLDADLLDSAGVRTTNHPTLGICAAFPYPRDGKTYACKFRSVEKKWRSTEGVERSVYNEDALREFTDLPVIITEGEMDCLSIRQAGKLRCISLPDGWTKQGNKTGPLLEVKDVLMEAPCVIVAGDNDDAGESLPRTVFNMLPGKDVRVVEWPEGCKDANDVLVRMGESKLVEVIEAAKQMDPVDGFITGISDRPRRSKRRVLRGNNDLLRLRVALELGAMSVFTGTPGSGKSTFTTWMADNISKHEDIRVGLMAFETHDDQTVDHLSRLNTGRPYDDLTPTQQNHLDHELDKRWKLVHRSYDGNPSHHMSWLLQMIYMLAVRDGCKLIIIDPWNELEHLQGKGQTLTEYTGQALQALRQIAERLEVHICVVAHPKKMESGGAAPKGYDIADSAHFANKPSLGVTVHNRRSEGGALYTEIGTWKVRNVQLYGIEKGVCAAIFNKEGMSYERCKDLEASPMNTGDGKPKPRSY